MNIFLVGKFTLSLVHLGSLAHPRKLQLTCRSPQQSSTHFGYVRVTIFKRIIPNLFSPSKKIYIKIYIYTDINKAVYTT